MNKEFSIYNQPSLKLPVPKFIPPGQYIAIDEMYYKPVEKHKFGDFANGTNKLVPPNHTVNYSANGFVEKMKPMIAANYGSYIYNQLDGWQ